MDSTGIDKVTCDAVEDEADSRDAGIVGAGRAGVSLSGEDGSTAKTGSETEISVERAEEDVFAVTEG